MTDFDPESWVKRADAIGMEPTYIEGWEKPARGDWRPSKGLYCRVEGVTDREEGRRLNAELFPADDPDRNNMVALCQYLVMIDRALYRPKPEE